MRTYMTKKNYLHNERALALDELLPERNNDYDHSPGVYVRSDRDRELDILWQGTRVHSREEKSPVFYLSTGFVAGIVSVFLISAFINFGNPSSDNTRTIVTSDAPSRTTVHLPDDGTNSVPTRPAKKVSNKVVDKAKDKETEKGSPWWKFGFGKNASIAVFPSFKDEQLGTQTYTVKSGDTLEAIAYRFYGMGGPIRVARIQTANNIESPDQLQIGQNLVIPVEN